VGAWVEKRTAYRLENNLLEPLRSCDGEPAPDRVLPAILPEFKAPRKGDLSEPALEGSVGDVFAVEDPERGKLTVGGR
jgi:hypothetical protein